MYKNNKLKVTKKYTGQFIFILMDGMYMIEKKLCKISYMLQRKVINLPQQYE